MGNKARQTIIENFTLEKHIDIISDLIRDSQKNHQ
jgi:hypothetical protein